MSKAAKHRRRKKLERMHRKVNLQAQRQVKESAGGIAKRYGKSASMQVPPPEPPSHDQPEDEETNFALLEKFDGYAKLRNTVRDIAQRRGEWAGIPMVVGDVPLVVESHYPNAKKLMAINAKPEEPPPEGVKFRNSFWSMHKRAEVYIWQEPNGKVIYGLHHSSPFSMTLGVLNVSDVWGIEQESRAVNSLAKLLPHRQFKQYMLTGMFVERSRRTNLSYVFRRLKPTVVLDTSRDPVRVRCTLCLHPIAYYANTWAGAMCPTDDLIAHLMLMRGDEPMLWRRANQHPAWRPESGLI